jgi:hypothetical protein
MPRDVSGRAWTLACLLAVAGLLALPVEAPAQLFSAPAYYDVGISPQDVAAGDLDRDGLPDLVVANQYSAGVSVLLNDGDGTFSPAVPFPAGSLPLAVTVARMDDDLHPDVVVSNSGSNSISVLLNDGAGALGPAADYPVGSAPWGLIAEDLNGDGAPDVAVVCRDSDSFWVLLNDGAGALSFSGSYHAGGAYISPSWIAGGDFDGDDDIDVAVVKNYRNLYFTASYVQLFRNDGSGGFVTGPTIVIGGGPGTATTPLTEDFDGDGDVDIAVSGFVVSSNKLAMLLNNGDGTFAEPEFYSAGARGRACAGDFDFDHDLDVVISRADVYGASFSVLLNSGGAAFASPFTVAVGDDPRGLACADLDADGDCDVAVAVSGDDRVAVVLSNANPTGIDDSVHWGSVSRLALHQNRPNPFGAETRVAFTLPSPAPVSVRVYDPSGRLVRTLLPDAVRDAGRHTTTWDARDERGRRVASGVYLCRVVAGGATLIRRMVLLR